MLQEFFINVVEDYKNKVEVDELKKPIQAAYQKTLLPFHGWLLQQTFTVSGVIGCGGGAPPLNSPN